ncbi:hypothetical protein FGD67_17330 [Colwellia sp. M166]|jgi:C4-dicarboxylate transporter|uniref:hypothetical protein n=1 Tax=Colwellia sp. M166 TaxID=2583805 RepID=UPI00211E32E8|nr:hypothetical protein [Colwellia sp. M166]UUO24782.1 hypothetical protein FGD67_17330 [Colwellia sp. M166]|tara:strand:+ start:78330 stop:78788 length:459 start_codon:yes stop_codon:yes gene_type:complete
MSYKERSIWVSLAITLYIWFNYFSDLYWSAQQNNLTISSMQSALLTVVIMTIALEILHYIIIAIIDHKNTNYDEDERDKQISLIGSTNAYYILSFTIITAVLHLLFPIMSQGLVTALNLPSDYVIINIIIFGALVAEITKFSTQVFYYRKGF